MENYLRAVGSSASHLILCPRFGAVGPVGSPQALENSFKARFSSTHLTREIVNDFRIWGARNGPLGSQLCSLSR